MSGAPVAIGGGPSVAGLGGMRRPRYRLGAPVRVTRPLWTYWVVGTALRPDLWDGRDIASYRPRGSHADVWARIEREAARK